MTSVVSEAAKNSCVPMEQNGLVAEPERIVQTGLNFAIPKLNIENLKYQTVYLIGDTETIEAFGESLYERIQYKNVVGNLFKVKDDVGSDYIARCTIICRRTILDIPKEYRSNGIVICFDEPSYNGRQCLFHLYGAESVGLSEEPYVKFNGKPYQAFTQLIEGVQGKAMDSAIVFVPKALQNEKLRTVMWCSAKLEEKKKPCPPVSQPPVTQDPVTTQLAALTEAIAKLTVLIEAKLA
jgi:hypothetical protein